MHSKQKKRFFIFSHTNFTCHFQNLSPPLGHVQFGSDFFLNVPNRLINNVWRTEFWFRPLFDKFLSSKVEFNFYNDVFFEFFYVKKNQINSKMIFELSLTRSIDGCINCDVLTRKIIFHFFNYGLWLIYSKLFFSSKHHNLYIQNPISCPSGNLPRFFRGSSKGCICQHKFYYFLIVYFKINNSL